ncbi:MAG: phosphoglycerate mutase family protein [Gemmatimonadaceae bacterium]
MIHSLRWLAALAAITLGCAAAAPARPPVVPADRGETTVYLVRHAEKATENPSDPELSKAGYARADSLASQLREAGVNVIITTQLKRTVLTARPLARMRGIVPEVVPVGNPASAHIDSVVAAVRRHRGGTILVVGHSNTIGHIAAALGGDKMGDLCDNEYSGLIILSMPRSKPTRMLVEHYGLPDGPGNGACTPKLPGH